MNPNTGEVKPWESFEDGEPRVPLEQEPDPKCPMCNGRGSIRKASKQRKKKYRPCYCTYKDYVPIEQQHKDNMQEVAKMLQIYLDGAGFCLLVFDFKPGGRLNYIANAEKEPMVEAIKEFISYVEESEKGEER